MLSNGFIYCGFGLKRDAIFLPQLLLVQRLILSILEHLSYSAENSVLRNNLSARYDLLLLGSSQRYVEYADQKCNESIHTFRNAYRAPKYFLEQITSRPAGYGLFLKSILPTTVKNYLSFFSNSFM